MYRINPGEFKNPIKIITVIPITNYDFLTVEDENILLETRAKIINTSGKEAIAKDGINATNIKRFYIRYKNVDIDTDCKVLYKNKKYNITYVSDVEEKHKYFEIVAEVVE